MKPNPKTGELILPSSVILSSQLTRSMFLASVEGKRSEEYIKNEPWCSFRFEDNVDSLGVTVFYKGESLESVQIYFIDPKFGIGWNDWSTKKEIERNEANNLWLKKSGLAPGKRYSWGSVSSGYDPKSGSSYIVIRY